MSEDVKARFERATQEVTCLSQRPDNMMLLRLYALYKQATEGDCAGKRPGVFDLVGKAKFDAWTALKGMSSEDSMTTYIEVVEELKAADQGKSSG